MATISMTMTSTVFTGTKTWTSTDANMQKILDWGAYAYKDWIQQQFNPPGLNFNPNFVPTNAQIAAAIANFWMQHIVERGVGDINTTPPVVPPPMGWS